MKRLINAEIKNINLDNSTFDVVLSFQFAHKTLLHARIFCRVNRNMVDAYNVGIMAGTCPCCLKPTCYSFYAKRHELLKNAQRFIEFPKELFKENSPVIVG
jgi:hypothetical protein